MAQRVTGTPFPLDVLVERGPVLARRNGAYYVVYIFQKQEEPVAMLSWFRVRRVVDVAERGLELEEDLAGRRLVDAHGGYYMLRLPERYQEHGQYIACIETHSRAEFAEEAPIPKPPGRLPVEWRDGRWYRSTARGRERYGAGGWVRA